MLTCSTHVIRRETSSQAIMDTNGRACQVHFIILFNLWICLESSVVKCFPLQIVFLLWFNISPLLPSNNFPVLMGNGKFPSHLSLIAAQLTNVWWGLTRLKNSEVWWLSLPTLNPHYFPSINNLQTVLLRTRRRKPSRLTIEQVT